MEQLNKAKDRAFSYIEELSQAAAVRQFFSEIIIGRNGELMATFNYDSTVRSRLQEAAKLKATQPTALYRGLYVQASSIFEAYVRDMSSIVVDNKASKVRKYSELSDEFRIHHIHTSSQILQHMKTGSLAGQKFEFGSLTHALGQCFSDSEKFSLMPEVFTLMMGNATPDRLESLFAKIGLPEPFNPGVGKNGAIQDVLRETRQMSAAKLAKEKLKDIIGKRNSFVHGNLSSTVEHSDFDEAVKFFGALITAFHDMAISTIS